MKHLLIFLALTACAAAQPTMPFANWKASSLVTVYPLRHNLIAAYQFETNGNDTTANAFHLTNNNGATFTPGLVGYAVDLTRWKLQSLSVADTDSLDLVGTSFTIAAWVYYRTDTTFVYYPSVLQKGGNLFVTNEAQYGVLWASAEAGKPAYAYFDSTALGSRTNIQGTRTVTLGSWHFVVFSYAVDRNSYSIYLNDSTKDSLITAKKIQNTIRSLVIGGAVSADRRQFIDGKIDQVFIWRRELTAAERTFLYNSRNGRSYAEVMGYTP